MIQVSDRECSKNLNCRPIYYGYQGQNLEQNIKINNIIRGKLVICCDESHTPEIQGYLYTTNIGKQSVHDMQNKVLDKIWHLKYKRNVL